MLKECLLEIANSTLDLGDQKKSLLKRIVSVYEEDQLQYLLDNGIMVENVIFYYKPGIGFRLTNDPKLGTLPLCNLIQKILNNKLQEIYINKIK